MIPSPLLTWRRQMAVPIDAEDLDREVLTGIEAAEGDPRIATFLEQLGGPFWNVHGLYAGRAYLRGENWERREKGDETACLMLPLIDAELTNPAVVELGRRRGLFVPTERWHVVDILAIEPSGAAAVASLTGNFGGVLGPHHLGLCAEPWPLRVHRSPFAWLRHVDAFASQPAPVCLAWPHSSAARDLYLYAGELIADDDEHAEELQKAIRAARKAALPPPPRVLVAVEDQPAASEAA